MKRKSEIGRRDFMNGVAIEIHKTEVVMTLKDGDIVYQKN